MKNKSLPEYGAHKGTQRWGKIYFIVFAFAHKIALRNFAFTHKMYAFSRQCKCFPEQFFLPPHIIYFMQVHAKFLWGMKDICE